MYRVLFVLAVGLILAAGLVGCETAPAPTPVDVRATAVTARGVAEQTLVALNNATATVTTGEFQRVKPLLNVRLKDDGSAGAEGTRVQIWIMNSDKAAHRIVIRLYNGLDPLNAEIYHIGMLDLVPPGGEATTVVSTTIPFADVRAQVQQIDNIWDYTPPPPQ